MIIRVINTVSSVIGKRNPKLESTKNNKEAHWLGITSMPLITKKYYGDVHFLQIENVFSCKILLEIRHELKW